MAVRASGFVPPGLGDYFIGTDADFRLTRRRERSYSIEAGYIDTDGDGIRECKAGQDCPTGDLTFRFNFPDDSDTAPREAELISQMWAGRRREDRRSQRSTPTR